jgi:hypothetical protein
MRVIQDIKKTLWLSKTDDKWYWCDRGMEDSLDDQQGPFDTFLEAVEDAVDPYVNEKP